jgi:putative heme degradation protein
MVRTQITLETELQRRARQRAGQVGISLAEYVRRLVARDLARPEMKADVSSIFDLGASGGSNIAVNKDSMIAEAFSSVRGRARPSRSSAL